MAATSTTHHLLFFTGYSLFRSPWPSCSQKITFRNSKASLFPISVKLSYSRFKCSTKSTEESEPETLTGDSDEEAAIKDETQLSSPAAPQQRIATSTGDSLSLGIREPFYEVIEVTSNGMVSTSKINRRQLLKSSGLRPRDIRSVDPSLWLTNSMPSLLVREHAILLNLGSLRAIAMQERVLIFNYNRKAGKAFIDALLPRLNPKNMNGGPSMPFELESARKLEVPAPESFQKNIIYLRL